jgi:plastocyanin
MWTQFLLYLAKEACMLTNHQKEKYILFPLVLSLILVSSSFALTRVINFGGALGLTYSPAQLNANIGDTISWRGDFSMHPLSSTSVPQGAATFSNSTGTEFNYVIIVPGTYQFRCDFHFAAGMVGSFTAASSAVLSRPSNVLSPRAPETIKGAYDVLGRSISSSALINYNSHKLANRIYLYQTEKNGMVRNHENVMVR